MHHKIIIRLLLNCLLFFLSFPALFAQKKVEKLETDKDVVKFVQAYFAGDQTRDWKQFSLVDLKEWKDLYNMNQAMVDSLDTNGRNQKWAVTDVDGDGKMDLIVSGFLPNNESGKEFFLFLFTTVDWDNTGYYQVTDIIKPGTANYPLYFSVTAVTNKRIAALRLVQWAPNVNQRKSNATPFTVDTVALADKYLVEYNPSPDSAVIQHVSYQYLGLDGKVKVELDALDKGSISPFSITLYKENRKDSTLIKGKITTDIYAQLLALINYSGFKTLPAHFLPNSGESVPIHILHVVYADGTEKDVEDDSGMATYTLDAVYDWMDWLIDYSKNSYNVRRLERNMRNR